MFRLCPFSIPLWLIIRRKFYYSANPKCKIFADKGIRLPNYATGKKESIPERPIIHSSESIKDLQVAGLIARKILAEMGSFIQPGISTFDVETFVVEKCLEYSVYPSSLAYEEFPGCVCTSLNEVAIHGIPSPNDVLQSGDLLSVDVTVFTGTAHGDACETFLVVDRDSHSSELYASQEHLLSCAKRACEAGIAACAPGSKFSTISKAISQEVFEGRCRVIAGIGGHGIGDFFHGPPYVPHCVFEEGSADVELQMLPGHVFTIEPAVAAAASAPYLDAVAQYVAMPVVSKGDGWSVRTSDGVLTAQFEETVLITDNGVRVLTR
ncbi:Methionine aminopeptidase 1D, mitochondrial [Echinococcus granulosus]|uniref:Methionine aminopeptidase n=1 Tax=Echinococcus granulosus TaxID=6210 RepID=U6J5U8_ECHGR|nr:Methionine aminopeptidase [Echinococcus granulosus]EUB57045.1 Methionine aminopeptidase [Echinococcus granulosus]KAH9282035.1 Methionine aminopeptidase 1D, mitochondrial [Echinococcus granulosus]CDS18709.1 methionine aminopeptidase type I [Echinococcus granulosus]